MIFLDEFLLLFGFAAECYIAGYIYTFTLNRRKHFWVRLLISILATIALLAIMVAVCTNIFAEILVSRAVCCALILIPVNCGWLAFCFKDSAWNIIFCAVFGSLTQLGTLYIIYAIKALIPDGSALMFFRNDTLPGLLCQYIIIGVFYIFMYFFVGKRYERNNNFTYCGKRLIPLYLFTIIIMPLMSLSGILVEETNPIFYALFLLCDSAVCFLVIKVQFTISHEMLTEGRKEAVDALLTESQKQYKMLKESIEIINLKCHDMRHQIRAIESGKISVEYLAELEKNISIYDNTLNTGNDVLNIILTDKNLRCSANGIEFTCITDGKLLSFMSESDINSLFGNALENAIEYETTIEDKDKRFISLTVRNDADMLFIRIENYWCGEDIRWEDGLPLTTKGSENVHGFGMLSMRRIAEKYGGEMQVKTEDDLFKVVIIIPLK